VIRRPEDNRPRLFLSASFERDRLSDADVADVFVFITSGILFFLLEGRDETDEIHSAYARFRWAWSPYS
jgi:hypothetical protein